MKVAELTQVDLKTVSPDMAVAEAVVTFADAHVHGVPVTDSHHRLVGVLSTTDILEATAECNNNDERDQLFENTRVSELMTSHVETISANKTIEEAAHRMLDKEVHRLFVEDPDGYLIGVISQTDIVRAVATSKL